MAAPKHYIAVDLGAESGRVMLGTVTEETLELQECYRFGNGPIEENSSLKWDIKKLFSEIKEGISRAVQSRKYEIGGIAVDSWGVDFGLLDENGDLLENPYHYRDSQTDGILEKAFALLPKRDIYEQTGIQFLQFNSVYQLLAMKLRKAESLKKARSLLFIADLVAWHLCGEVFAEYTLASTSQLMDMRTGKWSQTISGKLGLPDDILPRIVQPGTIIGHLRSDLVGKLGCGDIPVIAAGSHDTACAVAGVPVRQDNWAYLSSGTWSLMGLEIPQAIINDKTYDYQLTNEGGVDGTIRLLKNIMGLWLVQECRRQWQREGEDLSYTDLTRMAKAAQPFTGCVNTDYHAFLSPGDMPDKINRYLREHGREPISDKGQIIRIILESLALKYRWVLEKLEDCIGKQVEVLHIVGGGIQNELLCQLAANATGKRVLAGPIEATASGNIIMQAMAAGQVKSLQQGRDIIGNSFELKEYEPLEQEKDMWERQYRQMDW